MQKTAEEVPAAAETEETTTTPSEVHMRVTTKRPASFYTRSVRSFLTGVPVEEGGERKDPVREMTVSGLGEAVVTAITAATAATREGLARITRVETSYPGVPTGRADRGCPRILIKLERYSAAECKADTESLIAALRTEAEALVGKEHHKERARKGKAIAELRAQERYIDACRVARGQAPLHGHFAAEAAAAARREPRPEHLDPQEAARLAATATSALKRVDQQLREAREAEATAGAGNGIGNGNHGAGVCVDGPAEELLAGWQRRLGRLEARLSEPTGASGKAGAAGDAAELERVAREVVAFRQRLQGHGHRSKNPKAYRDVQALEARLDTLAGALLPPAEDGAADVGEEAEELRQWERRLTTRLAAQCTHSVAGLGPAATKEAERLIEEISELKAALRAQGLTEHEQDKDERVLLLSLRLAELRQYAHCDKKQERRERPELEEIGREVGQVRGKLEAHKRRLREERGLSHRDLKLDPEVRELEERMAMLQRIGGA